MTVASSLRSKPVAISAADLRRNPRVLEALRTSDRDAVDVVGGRVGACIVLEPTLARRVLADVQTFDKAGQTTKLSYASGDGTATTRLPVLSEQDSIDDLLAWRRQRREALQPVLVDGQSSERQAVFEQAVDRQTASWVPEGIYDLAPVARAIAVDSFVSACASEADRPSMLRLAEILARTRPVVDRAVRSRLRSPFDRDFSVRTRAWQAALSLDRTTRAIRRRRHAIEELMSPVVERARGGNESSIFGRLVAAATTGGGEVHTHDLVGRAVNVFVAGWESTATALTWMLWLVAVHPELQDDLATSTDDRKRELLRAAVMETLRMYPPVWSILREARCATEVGTRQLASGEVVIVAPWILHYRVFDWESPDVYRPERFLGGNPPPSYLPFGVGERACQGRSLGLGELQHITSSLLRRWRFTGVGAAPTARLGAVQYADGPALARVDKR